MKASGKMGSNGVWVSDNVEKRFEAFSESECMAPFFLILAQDCYGCLVLRPFNSDL
jgi:hypothetical protein